ncbi:peroxiredoxin [Magnetococcales bacterium HHB-1]
MLEIGSKIPDLVLPDQEGTLRTTLELIGDKGSVFYFYPKDNTPGCSIEAQDFQKLLPKFFRLGFTVVGISRDPVKSHAKFCSKYDLAFPLLSDEKVELCTKTGVWQEKRNFGKTYMGIVRTTLILDGDGVLRKLYKRVKVKGHAEAVLSRLESL